MDLIGLTGHHHGDTRMVARRLAEQHNFAQLRFDDPLRDMLAALLQLGRERVDALLHDRHWREAPLWGTEANPRQLLHSLSTEWGRRGANRELWIALLRQKLSFIADDLPHEYSGVVISDVRFENEARFVRAHGVLVHIARPESAPVVSIAGELLKFHSGDQILLNLGADYLERHTDHLVRTLRAQRVA